MASAETSSAGIRRATSSATTLLPEAVGPKIARTSTTEPGAGELELLLADADVAQVRLHAAVAAPELGEDALHRGRRSLGDPPQALELLLALRRREPGLVPRQQPLLAERVVRGDLAVGYTREVQQERGEQARPVRAAAAVDDAAALGRMRYRPHGRGGVVPEPLEEDQVDVLGRRGDIGRRRCCSLVLLGDLLPLRLARLHERHVHDVYRQLGRRVLLALVVAAEVDHRADPVVDERAPPRLAELSDAVGSHDRAEAGLAPVRRRQPAKLADVETAVPGEIAWSLLRNVARHRGAMVVPWQERRECSKPEATGVTEDAAPRRTARSSDPAVVSSKALTQAATAASCVPLSVVEVAASIVTGTSSPAAAVPVKFTVVFRRVRPRRTAASVRLGPSTSTSSTRPIRWRLRASATFWTTAISRSIRSRLSSSASWPGITAASVPWRGE